MPPKLFAGVRAFSRQSLRLIHRTKTILWILLMEVLHFTQMDFQRLNYLLWQHRNPVFIPFCIPYPNLLVVKINVFDP